jgi:IS4 transposase
VTTGAAGKVAPMKKEIHSLTDKDITDAATRLDMTEDEILELDIEDIAKIYKRKFEWDFKYSLVDLLRDSILESKG